MHILQRIKNFEIMKGPVPMSMIHIFNKVWKVCARLTTFVYKNNLVHIDIAHNARQSRNGEAESTPTHPLVANPILSVDDVLEMCSKRL